MRSFLTKAEVMLLAVFAAGVAGALFGPSVLQPPHHHDFADARTVFGIAYGMDVLSNLPFALAGLMGAWFVVRDGRRSLSNMQRAMAMLLCAGLVLVTVGSSLYHLDPRDATLVLDRLAMSVAFAGLLGLAAAAHVSERAGAALGLALLAAAPASIAAWHATGNVLPWLVVQFGGMLMLGVLAMVRPREGAVRVDWLLVLFAYGVAKVLELNDEAVFELTGHAVSGHTLKHLVAAAATLPVVAALGRLRPRRQNAPVLIADEVAVRWWRDA
jgi:hypothetical protein